MLDRTEPVGWGARNRTLNNRTRICCVASYTTPQWSDRRVYPPRRGRPPGFRAELVADQPDSARDVAQPVEADDPADRHAGRPRTPRAGTTSSRSPRWSASATRCVETHLLGDQLAAQRVVRVGHEQHLVEALGGEHVGRLRRATRRWCGRRPRCRIAASGHAALDQVAGRRPPPR